jgi:L-lactate dehydrogenase
MDLNHCLSFAPTPMKIKSGSYLDCKDAAIVVIAAGANQNPGETRMDLINKNAKIFKDIINNVVESGFDGIFLVATNPVDIMTHLTYKYSGFEANKVIGSGTCLDTARLGYLIGNQLKINPKNINAYVLGEHGDSEFVLWSNANIGLQNISDFLSIKECQNIESEVKNAAYEIINKKGATYYGIGVCLVKITNAILNDENTILTISSYDYDNQIFIGGPTIINRSGAAKRIFVTLSLEETNKMQNSVNIIKNAIKSLE